MVIEAANFEVAANRVVSIDDMVRSGSSINLPVLAAMRFISSYTVNCTAPWVVCCNGMASRNDASQCTLAVA